MPVEGFGSHPDEGRTVSQTPNEIETITDIFTVDEVPDNQVDLPYLHQSSFLPLDCPHCEEEIETIRGAVLDSGLGAGLCANCSRILGQF